MVVVFPSCKLAMPDADGQKSDIKRKKTAGAGLRATDLLTELAKRISPEDQEAFDGISLRVRNKVWFV